jgi:hypothetical protein
MPKGRQWWDLPIQAPRATLAARTLYRITPYRLLAASGQHHLLSRCAERRARSPPFANINHRFSFR